MLTQVVDLNPVEPARLSLSVARGQKTTVRFLFKSPLANLPGVLRATTQALDTANPQLILRPRSRAGAYGYDVNLTGDDEGWVEIDGAAMQDPNGYTLELYSRDDYGAPTALLASGSVVMTGGAFEYEGPLGPMTLPVVEGPTGPAGVQGPAGIQGPQGTRGSMWFSGHGEPNMIGQVVGDQWLDVDTGNVWQWNGLGSWEMV